MNRVFVESLEISNGMGSLPVQGINRAFAENLESRNILVSSPLQVGTAAAGKNISMHVVGALDAWRQERPVEAVSAWQCSEDMRTPQPTQSPLFLSPSPGVLLY